MISVGSRMPDECTVIGPRRRPLVISTVAAQIASRYTGNAQITSSARAMSESTTPPKTPAISAISVPMNAQISADESPITSELRPP